jgi:predicted PurR-regulated permease PerM
LLAAVFARKDSLLSKIFCFLSGAFLFGVIGVIMAVPVALAIKVTLALLYDEAPKAALGSK